MSVRLATAGGPVADARRETAGFLVALGDSWFDYPFHDVLKLLDDDYGYNIESAAHYGHAIETMAYQGGQIDQFARCLERVTAHGAMPKALLLSGGGNDLAGREFGMLLNSTISPIHGWNDDVINGVIDQRVLTAYQTILATMNRMCEELAGRTFPILVHGYDYPVPDGRGFLGGWPFAGPWLEPGFREKGFGDLPANVELMRLLIDRFNDMLSALAGDPTFGRLHYINLRNTLSTILVDDEYEDSWANELHPTKEGFEAITAKFAAVLGTL